MRRRTTRPSRSPWRLDILTDGRWIASPDPEEFYCLEQAGEDNERDKPGKEASDPKNDEGTEASYKKEDSK